MIVNPPHANNDNKGLQLENFMPQDFFYQIAAGLASVLVIVLGWMGKNMHAKTISLGKEIQRGINSLNVKLDKFHYEIIDLRERVAILETKDAMGMNGTNKS